MRAAVEDAPRTVPRARYNRTGPRAFAAEDTGWARGYRGFHTLATNA